MSMQRLLELLEQIKHPFYIDEKKKESQEKKDSESLKVLENKISSLERRMNARVVTERASVSVSSVRETKEKPEKKRYKKSSKIISRMLARPVTAEVLIDIKDKMGVLKELTVVALNKINVNVVVDGISYLDNVYRWDDFAGITLYTDVFVARVDGSNYVLVIKDISFTKSLRVQIFFDSSTTVSHVFGVFDICEEI